MRWYSTKKKRPHLKRIGNGFWESDYVLGRHKMPAKDVLGAPEVWIFFLSQKLGEKAKWVSLNYLTAGEVTHWMPLPKPPQINEQGKSSANC